MRLSRFVPQPVKRLVPPPIYAYLDHVSEGLSKRTAPPFNSQTIREEMVRDLAQRLPAAAIIETGTYKGASTAAFAGMISGPVHTVEAFPRFFHYSQRALTALDNVHVHLGDSADMLDSMTRMDSIPHSHVLFYLDAHSSELPGVSDVADELPLARELAVVARGWKDSVVVIDDFEVADDPGYGFDSYGEQALNLTYLEAAGVASNFVLFYPAAGSSDESGAKRGCLIMATRGEAEDRVGGSSYLRPVP